MSRTDGTGKPAGKSGASKSADKILGEQMLLGIPVSSGIAIGPIFAASEPKLAVARGGIASAAVEGELARLDAAVAKSRKQLSKLRARLSVLPEESQREIAPLIDA